METLTSTITLRLLKPHGDTSWDERGGDLHALKSFSHRMVQAALLEEIIASHEERKADRLGAIKRELAEVAKYTKNERTKEWAGAVGSRVLDAVQMRARKEARNYMSKRFKQPMRIPSAKYPAPIYVRDGGWWVKPDGKALLLSIKLRAGRGARHEFICSPLKGRHWEIVRAIAKGAEGYKAGDLKLVYSARKDRKTGRKRGWEARISVTWPKPQPVEGEGVLAVHRGRYNFLYVAGSAGFARPLVSGGALLEFKQRMRARKASQRRHIRERGSGSRGRGRARAYATYRSLEDKEARYVRTLCQQAAAAAVKLALERGCVAIAREDYGGIDEDARYVESFPFFQLGEAIDWAAKKAGLEILKVPPEYISTTCLRCGEASTRHLNARTGVFHCPCGFDRPADFIAALNMLRRGGADMAIWEKRFKALDDLAAAAKGAT